MRLFFLVKYIIYTDGACSGNPGPGGWGAVILDEKENQINLSGKEKSTTNNRMELTAPIMALKKIKKNSKFQNRSKPNSTCCRKT